jgi:hypothetical protein
MSKGKLILMCLAVLGFTGCTSHLVFLEEGHVGLKAQFAANNPSPAQLSLGYRRGIVAVIPQQSKEPQAVKDSVSVTSKPGEDGKKTVTIYNDPNELMSLYTVFGANVGIGDPVEVHHFLATGIAAASLLANSEELRKVTRNLRGFDEKGGD